MAYDVGGAYARFGLNIENLETNYIRATQILDDLRARTAQPFVAKVNAQGVGRLAYQNQRANSTPSANTPDPNGGVPSANVTGSVASQNVQIMNALAGATNSVAAAEEKRLRTLAGLQRQMKELASANQTIIEVQKNYSRGTAEWNELEKSRQAILQQGIGIHNRYSDQLIREAKATNDTTRVQQLYTQAIKDANAIGDKTRATKLGTDQNKFNTAQSNATTASTDAQAKASERANAAEVRRLQSLASLRQQSGQYKTALDALAQAETLVAKNSKASIDVEKQRLSILSEATNKNQAFRMSEIDLAKVQESRAAVAARYALEIRKAQSSGNDTRANQLQGQAQRFDDRAARLEQKALDDVAKSAKSANEAEFQRRKSLAEAQRASGQYTGALKTLREAESLAARGSTQYNQVATSRANILRVMARDTEKAADAEIRAANATGKYAQAIKILNAELALSQAQGNTARTANLQAQLAQTTQQQRASGVFSSIANGAGRMIGPIVGATAALAAFNLIKNQVGSSLSLSSQFDQAQRAINAYFQNVNRGNAVMRDGIAFARQYGYSFNEIASAVEDAQIIMRTSNATTEQTLSVISRLQARQPSKTFQDAVRSVAELQAGQLQSIQRVFNIPAKYAQEAKKAIEGGADPIQAVDNLLNKLGNTSATLDVRTEGLAGAQRNWTNALEGTQKAAGDLLAGPATGLLNWAAEMVRSTGDVVEGFKGLSNLKNPGDILKNFTKNQSQSFSGGFDPRQFIADVANPGMTAFKVLSTTGGNAYKAIGDAGRNSAAVQEEANLRVVKSIDDVIRKAVQAEPTLKAYLGASTSAFNNSNAQGGSGFGDDTNEKLDKQIARINVLNSRYDEGIITSKEWADQLNNLADAGQRGAEAQLPFVENILKGYPDAKQRLLELQTLRQQMQQQIGTAATIQEKVVFIAEYNQVSRAIAEIESKSPIQISVEMQVGYMNEVSRITNELTQATTTYTSGLAAIRQRHGETLVNLGQQTIDLKKNFDKNEQRANRDHNNAMLMQDRDFAQQMQRSDQDYYRSRATALRDYQQGVARAQRDFTLQQNRQARDFARSEARLAEDADIQGRRQVRDRQLEDERTFADHLKSMQNIRRSYDVDNVRANEDYERKRRRLLAEGKIYEAQLLKEEFGIDRRRAGEDYGRSRSDESDSYAENVARRGADRARQDKDAREDAELARARRLADYALSRQDAQEDFARSQADAAAAFAQSQADAAAAYARQREQKLADYAQQKQDQAVAFAQQRADAEQQYREDQAAIDEAIRIENESYANQQQLLENEYNAHLGRLKQQLEDYKTEQDRIQELISQKVGEEQAKAIAAMERASKELRRIGLQETATNGLIGYKVGLEWVKGIGKAFTDYASNPVDIDKALEEVNKRLSGDSPPPKGPLREIDKGAANVAKAWNEAFTSTLGAGLDRKLQQYTSVLVEGAAKANLLTAGFRIEAQLDAEQHKKRLGYIRDEAQKRLDAGRGAPDYSHGSQLGSIYAGDPQYRVNPRDITPWESDRPRYAAPTEPAASRPIIQVVVPVGVAMDGQSVGKAVAPYIAEQFMDAADISVEVVEASSTIALQQPAFRSKLNTQS